MNYTTSEIWFIIAVMAVCTFLIRFSFLGIIGDKELSPLTLKLLRYTPVAVLPAMVAPLILWPVATDGAFDIARVAAAIIAGLIAYWRKNAMWGVGAGVITLYAGLIATGQL